MGTPSIGPASTGELHQSASKSEAKPTKKRLDVRLFSQCHLRGFDAGGTDTAIVTQATESCA
jgi:hypothetical protein